MRSLLKITLAVALVTIGALMVIAGIQGASGADVAQVSPTGTVNVTAAAAPSGKASADVIGYGTDKDTYNRGDKASGYIELKNTGDVAITEATVRVTLSRDVPALGTTSLGSKDFKVSDLSIQPGETKKAEFSVDIPKEYGGFSTAGDYRLNGKILVGGKEVGAFSKAVKVV
jgi:hypothetical protein